MDLEVFGQSLVEPSSIPSADEYASAPSSPLVSLPPTPIQPASPQELYPSQVELHLLTMFDIKKQITKYNYGVPG